MYGTIVLLGRGDLARVLEVVSVEMLDLWQVFAEVMADLFYWEISVSYNRRK